MKQSTIEKRFEEYLRSHKHRLTPQRRRIFERAYSTHEHFSAEELYQWLQSADGPRVSRATVYRTLDLLAKGGFVETLDTGAGELKYEHVLGHKHHDHMICMECGRIDEFHDERIEALQNEAARRRGFEVHNHVHRLMGLCKACRRRSGSAGSDQ